jgi:hypothetical protein
VVNYLRDNKLLAVRILHKRHAELENKSAFVSSITIAQMIKGEAK